jgi:hypothetical protein
MGLPQVSRYQPGTDFLSFEQPPAGVTPEIVALTSEDGAATRGVLYSKGRERTIVCVLHPRSDMTRHYLIPYFLAAGYAVFGQESRWPGNDIAASHEMLLADVAAAMRWVRERGFEKVVCLGYSGAGSIYSFYQAQAVTAAPQRLTHTAGGDPFDLNKFSMPPADGVMFVGSHLGAGKTLQTELDPSVVDEEDPLAIDPSLDMYNPDNGFREPPEPTRYSADFIVRYRAAQIERVKRIDAIARSMIAEQRRFQEMSRAESYATLPLKERAFIGRRAVLGRFMRVYRTDANPATVDLSIDPSERNIGSVMSLRPDLSNYMENGFARNLTPRAWLSLWSGASSRASVVDNLPKVTAPTAVLCYTGDNGIHPAAAKTIMEKSPASDKQLFWIDGDHFGFLLPSKPVGGRKAAGEALVRWLRERFPGER